MLKFQIPSMPPQSTLTRQVRHLSQTRWRPSKLLNPTPSESRPPPSPPVRKHAVITGASGGIGAAIARRFAEEGMACILIGRSLPRLQKTLDSLPAKGVAHRIQMGDVSDKLFWRDFVKNMVSA
jgi:FlaA1/EpsC-like NDP-sugar epimerase